MPVRYRQTDLSMGPPLETSDTETRLLAVPYDPEGSGVNATSAVVRLLHLATHLPTAVQPTISAVSNNSAVVTLDCTALSLKRGEVYELMVTYTLTNGEERSGTLVVRVVA